MRRAIDRAAQTSSSTHVRQPESIARLPRRQNADAVIFAMAVRTRSGSGSIATPESARKAPRRSQRARPTFAISFGHAVLAARDPDTGTYVCAYGIQPVMQVAVVHALFGRGVRWSGNLPGHHSRIGNARRGIMKK